MDLSAPRWRKAPQSGAQNCVEVAHTLDAIRDSKGPQMSLTVDAGSLLNAVKIGQFDHR